MSVGKPGCGSVVMSTARSGRSPRRTRTALPFAADLDAGLAELGDDGLEVLASLRCSGGRLTVQPGGSFSEFVGL